MILVYVNYFFRLLIIAFGLFLLFDNVMPQSKNLADFKILGVIITLFGIYRLVMYHVNLKKRKYEYVDDEE